MPEIIHFCAPDWHNGERVPADYFIRSNNPDSDRGFAACRTHVEAALHVMMTPPDQVVIVRQVNDGT